MSVLLRAVAGKSRWSHLNLPDGFTLRCGVEADLGAVYRLNQQSFDPCWSSHSLYGAFASGYDLLICEHGSDLAGYLLSMTVLDELQIMQIAVAQPFRRQGLAEAMTQALVDSTCDTATIMLEVRVSNAAARGLYAKLGFIENGYRKNYYAASPLGTCEDAVLMELRLDK